MMTFEESCEQMRGWLTLKMCTGKFSQLLVEQLAWHNINRTVHVQAVFDQIGYLEDPSRRRLGTKAAELFKRPPLTKFWHQHWFEPRFLVRNLRNVSSPEAWKTVTAMSDAINRGDDPSRHISELTFGGYERRYCAGTMTGEWIVFGEVEGIKYYLTLGTHEDAKGDAAPLLQRLKICAIEFPEIQQLLPPP
jgi:hypothetical protein